MASTTRSRSRNSRRWLTILIGAIVLTVPSLVMMSVRASPARAWDIEDCTQGFDCPGDPGGGSLDLGDECLWDSCGDLGDVPSDPPDECTDSSCPDGQNPPAKQCAIVVQPDGTLVCTVSAPEDPDPAPPPDCFTDGSCPDPIVENPIDPSTCSPEADGPALFFNQDNFLADTLTTDPFPDMDPLYNDMCPPQQVGPPAPTSFGAADVAFGDSFISGEGRGPFNANVPSGGACDVADTAWPHLAYAGGPAAGAVLASASSVPFENWSCTGATIANTAGQITDAQRAGLTDDNVTHNRFAGEGTDTIKVEVSAGGNDVDFGPDLGCALVNVRHRNDNEHATHANGTRCIPAPAQFGALVTPLIPQLTLLYRSASESHQVAVDAISYPELFPTGRTPACTFANTGITRADQLDINADTLLLDDAIRQAAGNAGANFVDFSTALQGATVCDTQRGVNTLADVGGAFGHTMGAFHPNALGHQRLLASYMRQSFFSAAGFSASTPADGTLVGDRDGDSVYVAAGGALFPFPNQANLSSSIYNGKQIILEPSNQVAAQSSARPADGTLLKDASTAAIFAVSGGKLVPLAPSRIMLPAITVPSASLNGLPIADGSFFTISGGDGTVYEATGGAPVVVTNWSHVGGPQPAGSLTQAQFNSMPQTPADGTFVSAAQPGTTVKNFYEFAGGAPVYVSDFGHVGGQPATAPIAIDQTAIDSAGTGGNFSHINRTPADGTLVRATQPGTSTVSTYVFAGGAPIVVTDLSTVGSQPNGPVASVDETALDNAGTGGVYNHVRATPADGTYVTGDTSGGTPTSDYVFAGGAPIVITDWTQLGGPAADTPPDGVSPVTVDENSLENAGSGGAYNHVRAVPADGTILAGNADKINGIFVVAGGAPLYVPDFEDIGGARPSVSVDQAAIDKAGGGGVLSHLRAHPADGTLVESFGSGHIFVIAGGAPLPVSALADIGSPTQTPTFVDQVALDRAGSGGFYNHLSFRPADNTLLAGNGTNMFVVAGGAPIYVSDLEDIGGARPFVTVDETAIDHAGSGGDWAHLSLLPADGTIVESFDTGSVYKITGGVPALACSAAQTFLYVDQAALNKAGTGGFYNHLKPLPTPPPPACPKPTPPPGPGL